MLRALKGTWLQRGTITHCRHPFSWHTNWLLRERMSHPLCWLYDTGAQVVLLVIYSIYTSVHYLWHCPLGVHWLLLNLLSRQGVCMYVFSSYFRSMNIDYFSCIMYNVLPCMFHFRTAFSCYPSINLPQWFNIYSKSAWKNFQVTFQISDIILYSLNVCYHLDSHTLVLFNLWKCNIMTNNMTSILLPVM